MENNIEAADSVNKALVGKLVNGRIAIDEAKRSLEEKIDIIHKIADQLQYLSMGLPEYHIEAEPHLVNLLENEPLGISIQKNTDDILPPFNLICKWKRVYKDKWVLGVDLERNCKWATEDNVQLLVTSPFCPMTNISKVYFREDTVIDDSNDVASDFNKMGAASIITHDALSNNPASRIALNLSLMLENISETSTTVEPGTRLFMDLGDFICDTSDLIQSDHQIDIQRSDPSHDLVALKILTRQDNLNFTSSSTELTNLESILSTSQAFTWHPSSGILCASRTHAFTQLLDIAWLHVTEKVGTHHLKVDFHTKNISQLLLLVHILYKILPDDVVISIQNSEEQDFPVLCVAKVARHLMSELDYIIQELNKPSSAQSSQAKSTKADLLREQVAKERNTYKKLNMGIDVNAEKYHDFIRCLWKLQLKTEKSLSELTAPKFM